jgi:hypothetical protein
MHGTTRKMKIAFCTFIVKQKSWLAATRDKLEAKDIWYGVTQSRTSVAEQASVLPENL